MSVSRWLGLKRGPLPDRIGLGEWNLIGRRMRAMLHGHNTIDVTLCIPGTFETNLATLTHHFGPHWECDWNGGAILGLDQLTREAIKCRALALHDAYLNQAPIPPDLELQPSPILQNRLEQSHRPRTDSP